LKEESCGLTSDKIEQRKVAPANLAKVILMEEISWRQKSKTLWLKAGDRNAIFFHKMAISRRKFNYTGSIMIDEKSAIHDFHSSPFTENEPWRPKVDRLVLPSIIDSQRVAIEHHFSEAEVLTALQQCGDKAPSQMV